MNPMEPLPYFYTPDVDGDIRDGYHKAIKQVVADSADAAYVDAHTNVADVNLNNRLKHISRNASLPPRSEMEHEYIRLSRHSPSEYNARMAQFVVSHALPSLEIVTDLQVGQAPHSITASLAKKAFNLLADFEELNIVEDTPRQRVKVTRTMPVGDTKAAVVTVKTDQLSLRRDDGELIDVKTRQSGFVILDNRLEDQAREAFRILGDMKWGEVITDELVEPFRQRVSEVLREEEVFHPTLSTLFLARRVKRD